MKRRSMACLSALFLSLTAHAEFTIILTSCEFTSDTPEQQARDYVQVRRTYESSVGSGDPQDQITYQGLLLQHAEGVGSDTQLSEVTVNRTPAVPAIPKKTVQFQEGTDFNLTIDLKTLQGTFAYKNSSATQPVNCSVSGDGKYW